MKKYPKSYLQIKNGMFEMKNVPATGVNQLKSSNR